MSRSPLTTIRAGAAHSALLIAAALLASCGGGGGGGSAAAPTAAAPPAPAAPTVAISGKVIDGYIAGATVFVDMNWSLAYEDGEPRTTTDSKGDWKFSADDLRNFACFKDAGGPRPIVVDVPAGAMDADRGAVRSPFRLLFLPSSWLGVTTNQAVANVTPFTTLFASAITDAVSAADGGATADIKVADGCGAAANAIGEQVRRNVGDIGIRLRAAGVDLSRFYDDFIATRDAVAAQKGQFIVDFLARYQQVADRVVASVQREVGAQGKLRSKYSINYEVIKQILDSNPAAVAFDLHVGSRGLTLADGSAASLIFHTKGMRIRSDGMLIGSACTAADPFACAPVPVENADQAIKASAEAYKAVVAGVNRSLTFAKGAKNGKSDCEHRFLYSYEPRLGTLTAPAVSQLEFVYKMPIVDRLGRYECQTGDEGVTFTRKLSYPPRANDYFYSLFRYFGAAGSAVVVDSLPYLSGYVRKNILLEAFDPARANAELALLPASPLDLDRIVTSLPGTWYLQSGSMAEDANLTYRASDGKFSCTVKEYNGSKVLRSVTGTKEQAVAMCYPDVSVF